MGKFEGSQLDRIAFPIGGIGAGMICLEGTGAFSHVSVRNTVEVYNEPLMFAALSLKGVENGTKLLEGPVRPGNILVIRAPQMEANEPPMDYPDLEIRILKHVSHL